MRISMLRPSSASFGTFGESSRSAQTKWATSSRDIWTAWANSWNTSIDSRNELPSQPKSRTTLRGMKDMRIALKRLASVPLLVVALACPGDKKKDTAQIPVDSAKLDSARTVASAAGAVADTTSTDLSKIKTN